MIKKSRPQLVFLMEMRLGDFGIDRLKIKFNMFGFGVASYGRSGGIVLLWSKDTIVTLENYSKHHIDAHVMLPNSNVTWRYTGFYGEPNVSRRKFTWNLLNRLGEMLNREWLITGDFNEILCNNEKKGGLRVGPYRLRAFRNCLQKNGLMDLGFSGFPYTWTNRRVYPDTIRLRLDRGVATLSWSNLFPQATISHFHSNYSGHSPLLLRFHGSPPLHTQRRRKAFQFESMWIQNSDCERVIQQNWDPDSDILTQLDGCKIGLMKWGRSKFGSVNGNLKQLRQRLADLREGTITSDSKAEEDRLKNELEKENLMWQFSVQKCNG